MKKHIFFEQIKQYLTRKIFSSVKSLILYLFIPIIAAITITVGIFAYLLLHQQLEEHA